MSKRGDAPVYPVQIEHRDDLRQQLVQTTYPGMTIREELAARFHAALLSDPNWEETPAHTALTALVNADALLAALEEEQKP